MEQKHREFLESFCYLFLLHQEEIYKHEQQKNSLGREHDRHLNIRHHEITM